MTAVQFLVRTNFGALLLGLGSLVSYPSLRHLGETAPAASTALAIFLATCGAGITAVRCGAQRGQLLQGLLASLGIGLLAYHVNDSLEVGAGVTLAVMEWTLARSRPGYDPPDTAFEFLSRAFFLASSAASFIALAGLLTGNLQEAWPLAACGGVLAVLLFTAAHRGCSGCVVVFGVISMMGAMSYWSPVVMWGPGLLLALTLAYWFSRQDSGGQPWP